MKRSKTLSLDLSPRRDRQLNCSGIRTRYFAWPRAAARSLFVIVTAVPNAPGGARSKSRRATRDATPPSNPNEASLLASIRARAPLALRQWQLYVYIYQATCSLDDPARSDENHRERKLRRRSSQPKPRKL